MENFPFPPGPIGQFAMRDYTFSQGSNGPYPNLHHPTGGSAVGDLTGYFALHDPTRGSPLGDLVGSHSILHHPTRGSAIGEFSSSRALHHPNRGSAVGGEMPNAHMANCFGIGGIPVTPFSTLHHPTRGFAIGGEMTNANVANCSTIGDFPVPRALVSPFSTPHNPTRGSAIGGEMLNTNMTNYFVMGDSPFPRAPVSLFSTPHHPTRGSAIGGQMPNANMSNSSAIGDYPFSRAPVNTFSTQHLPTRGSAMGGEMPNANMTNCFAIGAYPIPRTPVSPFSTPHHPTRGFAIGGQMPNANMRNCSGIGDYPFSRAPVNTFSTQHHPTRGSAMGGEMPNVNMTNCFAIGAYPISRAPVSPFSSLHNPTEGSAVDVKLPNAKMTNYCAIGDYPFPQAPVNTFSTQHHPTRGSAMGGEMPNANITNCSMEQTKQKKYKVLLILDSPPKELIILDSDDEDGNSGKTQVPSYPTKELIILDSDDGKTLVPPYPTKELIILDSDDEHGNPPKERKRRISDLSSQVNGDASTDPRQKKIKNEPIFFGFDKSMEKEENSRKESDSHFNLAVASKKLEESKEIANDELANDEPQKESECLVDDTWNDFDVAIAIKKESEEVANDEVDNDEPQKGSECLVDDMCNHFDLAIASKNLKDSEEVANDVVANNEPWKESERLVDDICNHFDLAIASKNLEESEEVASDEVANDEQKNESECLVDDMSNHFDLAIASKYLDESKEVANYEPKNESDCLLDDMWNQFDLAIASRKLDESEEVTNDKHLERKINVDIGCNHDICLLEDLGEVCRVCGMIVRSADKIFDILWKKLLRKRSMPREAWSKDVDQIDDPGSATASAYEDFIFEDAAIHPMHAKEMRPHQREGFEFLVKNLMSTGDPGGCIIAHAPGSGKTFMVISFIQSFLTKHSSARLLVVLPKGIVGTWKREFQRWQVEKIPLYDFYSAKADTRTEHLKVLKSWEAHKSILFLGYQQFSQIIYADDGCAVAAACKDKLLVTPNLLIMDEGHTPRNEGTNVLQSLRAVRTPRKVVLSGTLFQNHVKEVFNILNLVRPRFFKMGSSRRIVRRIMSQAIIAGCSSSENADEVFAESVEATLLADDNFERKSHVISGLRELTEDVLHYYKGDVLDELPGLVDFSVFLKLTQKQKDIFDTLEAYGSLKRAAVETAVYIHPCLKDISEADSNEKNWTDAEIESLIESINIGDGVKARFFLNIMSLADAAGEKLLAFSRLLLPMRFLERLLVKMKGWHVGKEIFTISGTTKPEDRELIMDKFNSSNNAKVLFGSIKACAEGISLVGASRVVVLDVHLNPSVTRQAIGRAFRPGQQKKVFVYRLVAADSLEEKTHATALKKEVIPKLWFEWNGMCTREDFKLNQVYTGKSGADGLLVSEAIRRDIKALFRR